jgi:hypothetical protein
MGSANWSTIDSTEVQQEFSSGEQVVLSAINAADQLPSILNRTVNRFRAVIDNSGYDLGPTATVPDSLRQDVVAIARWLWLVNLPKAGEALQTKARSEANDRAEKKLTAVSDRQFSLESPSDAVMTWDKAGNFGTQPKVRMTMDQTETTG